MAQGAHIPVSMLVNFKMPLCNWQENIARKYGGEIVKDMKSTQ